MSAEAAIKDASGPISIRWAARSSFDATPTHDGEGPATFLARFVGKLQADAYAGYDALFASGRVLEIGCWAHGRRRFVDAFLTDGSAAQMVALIQQLYQVEHADTDLDPEQRHVLRQQQSVPLLAKIETLRQELARTVLPKSPLGDAIRYLTNQWAAVPRQYSESRCR